MGDETKQGPDQKIEAPTCGICHKTKFADGCGHLCSYCQTKFCARCGGRVSLRSNKVTPACMFGTLHLLGHTNPLSLTHTHTYANALTSGTFFPVLLFQIQGYETSQWNHNLGIEPTPSLMATNVFSDYQHLFHSQTLCMPLFYCCSLWYVLIHSCRSSIHVYCNLQLFFFTTGGNRFSFFSSHEGPQWLHLCNVALLCLTNLCEILSTD